MNLPPAPAGARRSTPMAAAVRDNLAALNQAAQLLGRLESTDYTRRFPACFNSSAGGHLRHVIEHYASFLDGLGEGRVDYEARARDVRIETEPAYAAARVAALCAELAGLAETKPDRSLRVRAETAGAEDEAEGGSWADSCALRELEYLLSHTVHHYALIGVICALAGLPAPKDFGMAPSTLRFLRAQAGDAGAAA